MILLKCTQFNIGSLERCLHRSGKWRHSLRLPKGTVYKRVAPFVMQKYEYTRHNFFDQRNACWRWRTDYVFRPDRFDDFGRNNFK